MTYHAELAPRRRPWLIAIPLLIVLLLGAVWSGVWYYAAGEAETRMEAWRAQQARGGRVSRAASRPSAGIRSASRCVARTQRRNCGTRSRRLRSG